MRGRPSLGIGGPFCTIAAAVDGPAGVGVVVVMFVVAIVDVLNTKVLLVLFRTLTSLSQ
jgi:hypothetical protein